MSLDSQMTVTNSVLTVYLVFDENNELERFSLLIEEMLHYAAWQLL